MNRKERRRQKKNTSQNQVNNSLLEAIQLHVKKDFENEWVSSSNDFDLLENQPTEFTLQDHLEDQLKDFKLNHAEKKIALIIIQSLEENGLLQIDLDEIEELMGFAFSIKEIKSKILNESLLSLVDFGDILLISLLYIRNVRQFYKKYSKIVVQLSC